MICGRSKNFRSHDAVADGLKATGDGGRIYVSLRNIIQKKSVLRHWSRTSISNLMGPAIPREPNESDAG
jgi:hypothetical protein